MGGRSWLPASVAAGGLVLVVLLQPLLEPLTAGRRGAWATVFVAMFVQAVPFLALGVALSGAIAAWVRPALVARVLGRRSLVSVPAAGLAAMCLPGCECGSVPLAGRLMRAGARPGAAMTFLLAAPAVNPIVLVSTAVAFPERPAMVVARFLASFAAAVIIGALTGVLGLSRFLRPPVAEEDGRPRVEVFARTVIHDFCHAGGYLVIGAAIAATLQVVVPRSTVDALGGTVVVNVALMALLAFLLAVCSEADAFVAAGLRSFPLQSRLVFLVLGPMLDVKLLAMQIGTFGRSFAFRFASLTAVVAISSALLVGWWVL